MTYRPDIDGLRAISVLIVLLFHAKLPYIQAGFIGVDIFFVISGFLITGNILRSLDQGKFNVLTFYQRRFLRLAPALIVLIFVLMVVTLCFYLPEDLMSFTRSAKHALLYKTNLFFAKTTGGYFDVDSDLVLLLHTWSLAIEWQWYALLPLVLWGLHTWLPRRLLGAAVVVLLLMATSYSLYKSTHNAALTQHYYALSSRAFELLMGASISFVPYGRLKFPRIWLSGLGLGAIGVIIFVATQKNVAVMFPNYWALLICVCAALLITLGKLDPMNYASRLLAFKPLVFIGLISYSLYLWHWPIFSFVRYLDIAQTPIITLLLLILSVLMGYLSWKFIEQKTRYLSGKSFTTLISVLFLIPALSAYAIEATTKKHQGFINRFSDSLSVFEAAKAEYYAKGREVCINAPELEGTDICRFGDLISPQKRALVLGDSYANHYWNFLEVLAKDAHMQVESNTRTACMMLPDLYLYDWLSYSGMLYEACYDASQLHYKKIRTQQYDYVILGQVWSFYLRDNFVYKASDTRSLEASLARFETALDAAIKMIIQTGARPVIVDETYIDQINENNKCYLHAIKTHKKDFRDCTNPIVFNPDELKMIEVFARLKAQYPELIIINPKRVQCPNGVCDATINGIPIYRNTAHLNDYSSFIFGERYLKTEGNPFRGQ